MAGDADGLTWSQRVSVQAEHAWDNVYPAQWPATVRVHTAAKVLEARALDSWGDPALPWSQADVLDKAQRMLVSAAERARVSLALDALHDAQALRQLLQAWSP